MDRVVRDRASSSGQVQYSIIDFKVTGKPKSTAALLEAYQTQLELYGFALQALEPEARAAKLEALIVNISPRTIQALPLPLFTGTSSGSEAGTATIPRLAQQAARIVSGEPGPAIPGPRCRFCEFRPACPEGRAIELPSND